MADNLTEAILYAFHNDAASPDTGIHTPYYVSEAPPYSYFFKVTAPHVKEFLCDTDGGTAIVQFGIVRNTLVDAEEDTSSFISFLQNNLVGAYSNIKIYHVIITDERDSHERDEMLSGFYYKQLDAEIHWSI